MPTILFVTVEVLDIADIRAGNKKKWQFFVQIIYNLFN